MSRGIHLWLSPNADVAMIYVTWDPSATIPYVCPMIFHEVSPKHIHTLSENKPHNEVDCVEIDRVNKAKAKPL